MITYTGKYNSANVMIDEIDEETVKQIYSFLNHPAFAETYVAIMPDCHAGAGAVIGFTARMNDYVIPNVVGVDIGCGVLAYKLGKIDIDFVKLDNFIKRHIPSGFSIRSAGERMFNRMKPSEMLSRTLQSDVIRLSEKTGQETSKVLGSIGTLGGGNHFIEVDVTDDGEYWLVVHSGSRNFGLRVANYYQNKAKKLLKQEFDGASAYKGLEYLPVSDDEASMGVDYLDAMQVAQNYASVNRETMAILILEYLFKDLRGKSFEVVSSTHNYIDFVDDIIRKGAVSARRDERLIIPFNMRDGIAICRGKGNPEWNFSAPHGAGRILSRRKAKETLSLDEFTAQMEGIYTTTATQDTIDESPMAYKDTETIIDAIRETVSIEFMMKPVYNFKASGD